MRIIIILLVAVASSCTRTPKVAPTLADEGRRIFSTNCTACHNVNPKLDGALGPAIAGSTLELLEAKIIRGEYPPGYEPKRATKQMVPLPFIKDQIPALHAYLNQP